MTSDEIRLELFKIRKTGVNMAQIGRKMKPSCSRQAVSAVVDRTLISRRIMLAVSAALGCDARIVFPDYYTKKKRKRKTRKMPKF
ncbi:MAG: hypothetical protein GY859_43750 [Desulfobacterales bacterium]|nr:hypothetical protein [Desulfobacterales bacterium]